VRAAAKPELVTRKNLILRLAVAAVSWCRRTRCCCRPTSTTTGPRQERQSGSGAAHEGAPALDPSAVNVLVPANGEKRVDWKVRVVAKASPRTHAGADRRRIGRHGSEAAVHVHGMLKTESWAGRFARPAKPRRWRLSVPATRRADQSRLEIRYSPTLAGAMVDALPYLAEYRIRLHGTDVESLSASVITQRILLQLNLDLDAIRDKRTNLNAQELGDDRDRPAMEAI